MRIAGDRRRSVADLVSARGKNWDSDCCVKSSARRAGTGSYWELEMVYICLHLSTVSTTFVCETHLFCLFHPCCFFYLMKSNRNSIRNSCLKLTESSVEAGARRRRVFETTLTSAVELVESEIMAESLESTLKHRRYDSAGDMGLSENVGLIFPMK